MAFEKNWRDRVIVHRTPGGKLTRVKISSLPADEQQKYNPNRFKRSGADTQMSADAFALLQQQEIEAGFIFDFYVAVDTKDELSELESGSLVYATTDGSYVPEMFDIENKIILKLNNVPMDAVASVIKAENKDDVELSEYEAEEYEDIPDDLKGKSLYEKIKFNKLPIYQLDIHDYLPYIEVVVDMDEPEDDIDVGEVVEGFLDFYYKK